MINKYEIPNPCPARKMSCSVIFVNPSDLTFETIDCICELAVYGSGIENKN